MEVISEANFPSSAGLASSAAGFAAIAYGLGKLFSLDDDLVVQLARFGIYISFLFNWPPLYFLAFHLQLKSFLSDFMAHLQNAF